MRNAVSYLLAGPTNHLPADLIPEFSTHGKPLPIDEKNVRKILKSQFRMASGSLVLGWHSKGSKDWNFVKVDSVDEAVAFVRLFAPYVNVGVLPISIDPQATLLSAKSSKELLAVFAVLPIPRICGVPSSTINTKPRKIFGRFAPEGKKARIQRERALQEAILRAAKIPLVPSCVYQADDKLFLTYFLDEPVNLEKKEERRWLRSGLLRKIKASAKDAHVRQWDNPVPIPGTWCMDRGQGSVVQTCNNLAPWFTSVEDAELTLAPESSYEDYAPLNTEFEDALILPDEENADLWDLDLDYPQDPSEFSEDPAYPVCPLTE